MVHRRVVGAMVYVWGPVAICRASILAELVLVLVLVLRWRPSKRERGTSGCSRLTGPWNASNREAMEAMALRSRDREDLTRFP